LWLVVVGVVERGMVLVGEVRVVLEQEQAYL
jgi:hypothetical protein